MNLDNKALLAGAGFMGGIAFTIIVFHLNHKNILNESLYFWLMVFLGCLVFCLLAILKKDR